MPNKAIRWGVFDFEGWRLCLAASEQGLVYADRLAEGEESGEQELASWVRSHFRDGETGLVRDEQALSAYADQYREYFRGERTGFTFPLDMHGTPFQKEVWRALADIPFGKTCAYADIAERIGKPSSVRAAAGAIGANPVLLAVPCHRVIGKNGALTGFGGGLDLKAWLLNHESSHQPAALTLDKNDTGIT